MGEMKIMHIFMKVGALVGENINVSKHIFVFMIFLSGLIAFFSLTTNCSIQRDFTDSSYIFSYISGFTILLRSLLGLESDKPKFVPPLSIYFLRLCMYCHSHEFVLRGLRTKAIGAEFETPKVSRRYMVSLETV